MTSTPKNDKLLNLQHNVAQHSIDPKLLLIALQKNLVYQNFLHQQLFKIEQLSEVNDEKQRLMQKVISHAGSSGPNPILRRSLLHNQAIPQRVIFAAPWFVDSYGSFPPENPDSKHYIDTVMNSTIYPRYIAYVKRKIMTPYDFFTNPLHSRPFPMNWCRDHVVQSLLSLTNIPMTIYSPIPFQTVPKMEYSTPFFQFASHFQMWKAILYASYLFHMEQITHLQRMVMYIRDHSSNQQQQQQHHDGDDDTEANNDKDIMEEHEHDDDDDDDGDDDDDDIHILTQNYYELQVEDVLEHFMSTRSFPTSPLIQNDTSVPITDVTVTTATSTSAITITNPELEINNRNDHIDVPSAVQLHEFFTGVPFSNSLLLSDLQLPRISIPPLQPVVPPNILYPDISSDIAQISSSQTARDAATASALKTASFPTENPHPLHLFREQMSSKPFFNPMNYNDLWYIISLLRYTGILNENLEIITSKYQQDVLRKSFISPPDDGLQHSNIITTQSITTMSLPQLISELPIAWLAANFQQTTFARFFQFYHLEQFIFQERTFQTQYQQQIALWEQRITQQQQQQQSPEHVSNPPRCPFQRPPALPTPPLSLLLSLRTLKELTPSSMHLYVQTTIPQCVEYLLSAYSCAKLLWSYVYSSSLFAPTTTASLEQQSIKQQQQPLSSSPPIYPFPRLPISLLNFSYISQHYIGNGKTGVQCYLDFQNNRRSPIYGLILIQLIIYWFIYHQRYAYIRYYHTIITLRNHTLPYLLHDKTTSLPNVSQSVKSTRSQIEELLSSPNSQPQTMNDVMTRKSVIEGIPLSTKDHIFSYDTLPPVSPAVLYFPRYDLAPITPAMLPQHDITLINSIFPFTIPPTQIQATSVEPIFDSTSFSRPTTTTTTTTPKEGTFDSQHVESSMYQIERHPAYRAFMKEAVPYRKDEHFDQIGTIVAHRLNIGESQRTLLLKSQAFSPYNQQQNQLPTSPTSPSSPEQHIPHPSCASWATGLAHSHLHYILSCICCPVVGYRRKRYSTRFSFISKRLSPPSQPTVVPSLPHTFTHIYPPHTDFLSLPPLPSLDQISDDELIQIVLGQTPLQQEWIWHHFLMAGSDRSVPGPSFDLRIALSFPIIYRLYCRVIDLFFILSEPQQGQITHALWRSELLTQWFGLQRRAAQAQCRVSVTGHMLNHIRLYPSCASTFEVLTTDYTPTKHNPSVPSNLSTRQSSAMKSQINLAYHWAQKHAPSVASRAKIDNRIAKKFNQQLAAGTLLDNNNNNDNDDDDVDAADNDGDDDNGDDDNDEENKENDTTKPKIKAAPSQQQFLSIARAAAVVRKNARSLHNISQTKSTQEQFTNQSQPKKRSKTQNRIVLPKTPKVKKSQQLLVQKRRRSDSYPNKYKESDPHAEKERKRRQKQEEDANADDDEDDPFVTGFDKSDLSPEEQVEAKTMFSSGPVRSFLRRPTMFMLQRYYMTFIFPQLLQSASLVPVFDQNDIAVGVTQLDRLYKVIEPFSSIHYEDPLGKTHAMSQLSEPALWPHRLKEQHIRDSLGKDPKEIADSLLYPHPALSPETESTTTESTNTEAVVPLASPIEQSMTQSHIETRSSQIFPPVPTSIHDIPLISPPNIDALCLHPSIQNSIYQFFSPNVLFVSSALVRFLGHLSIDFSQGEPMTQITQAKLFDRAERIHKSTIFTFYKQWYDSLVEHHPLPRHLFYNLRTSSSSALMNNSVQRSDNSTRSHSAAIDSNTISICGLGKSAPAYISSQLFAFLQRITPSTRHIQRYILAAFTYAFGSSDFNSIAQHFPLPCVPQYLQEDYNEVIDPAISHHQWIFEEDLRLLLAVKAHTRQQMTANPDALRNLQNNEYQLQLQQQQQQQQQAATAAAAATGTTTTQSLLGSNSPQPSTTNPEVTSLQDHIRKITSGPPVHNIDVTISWDDVSSHLPHRTANQCRQRYLLVLSQMKNGPAKLTQRAKNKKRIADYRARRKWEEQHNQTLSTTLPDIPEPWATKRAQNQLEMNDLISQLNTQSLEDDDDNDNENDDDSDNDNHGDDDDDDNDDDDDDDGENKPSRRQKRSSRVVSFEGHELNENGLSFTGIDDDDDDQEEVPKSSHKKSKTKSTVKTSARKTSRK